MFIKNKISAHKTVIRRRSWSAEGASSVASPGPTFQPRVGKTSPFIVLLVKFLQIYSLVSYFFYFSQKNDFFFNFEFFKQIEGKAEDKVNIFVTLEYCKILNTVA